MQFDSCTFAVFFAAVVALHHLPLPWRLRKANLLLASYVFHAAWNPPFVVLLWISTLADWFVARGIHATSRPARNLMVTMLLGGLWHGASWTFVVWGGCTASTWSGSAACARGHRPSAVDDEDL